MDHGFRSILEEIFDHQSAQTALPPYSGVYGGVPTTIPGILSGSVNV